MKDRVETCVCVCMASWPVYIEQCNNIVLRLWLGSAAAVAGMKETAW